mmetsp:Transcript_32328/g.37936  ORF Transcript_32328/g.37936 Transcript_32328/m.37936 type:complete len:184 (+) Transcript_32328:58-609(+)|eukprot:CAMPEP_0114343076 /NCGR_PEP_ID=MMETSP0101-20121206/10322_1 /TAXON_ID=38822 ORGANISM="Pteridomonas danica, Strain PT" /NCGR_SAMPLE_ID=MMETSP0101 /ASSEMBLY_ACC=CAM_ASM_000211 /LENGTH=183 /DNA_ID=CAMNT_0001477591 /DNA_START=60 /DNA_END=611 /DNA_ORIENTATION=-
MSVNSGESEMESGDSENDSNDSNSEDASENSNELPETDVSEGEEEISPKASIQETMDIMNALINHMDGCKGRMLKRFPIIDNKPNNNAEEPIPVTKKDMKEVIKENRIEPPIPIDLPKTNVTIFDPYQHSHNSSTQRQLESTLTNEWESAPHVAEALKTLLLDRDDEVEQSILRHEHSRLLKK